MLTGTLIVQLFAALGIASLIAYAFLRFFGQEPARIPSRDRGQIVFLFDGETLIDATKPARELLKTCDKADSPYEMLCALLEPRFPTLRRDLAQLEDLGELTALPIDQDPGQVEAECNAGVTRIALRGDSRDSAVALAAQIAESALRDEVSVLRAMADEVRQLMWREDGNGDIVWANAAYLELCDRTSATEGKSWPPMRLFADVSRLEPGQGASQSRHAILPPDEPAPLWFDICGSESAGRPLFVAQDVSEIVRAEDTQRDMMQTLTKTFAGLAIGLSVFDKERRLVMFNPALGDLTKLRPAELISRPRMDTFLDMLRENRVLPEPRNYPSWRKQMTELEAASLKGDYVDTWTLLDGRSLRIVGRPFPNGAVALFFQDVSADMDLSRQLKATRKLGQDALDGVDRAIAIFGKEGRLTLANTAYRKLWQIARDDSGAETFAVMAAQWEADCLGSDGWSELHRKASKSSGARLRFKTQTQTGQVLNVRARHLSDGSLEVSFVQAAPEHLTGEDLRRRHLSTAIA